MVLKVAQQGCFAFFIPFFFVLLILLLFCISLLCAYNIQTENDQPQQPQISVKDRTQKFNRIASENALHLASQQPSPNKKKIDKVTLITFDLLC